MATKFVQQATKQIAPIYDQQIKAAQAQVPAIQQLYSTLTQGLQAQTDQRLASGVMDINEDASARGVLRSTLPTDARLSLSGQLNAALTEATGQLGLQQAKDITDLTGQVGQLQISKVTAIQELANAMRDNDLERQRLALQKLQANREYDLAKQELAISRSRAAREGGSNLSTSDKIRAMLDAAAGSDGNVSPGDWENIVAYAASKGVKFSGKGGFANTYWNYANPSHYQDYLGDKYKKYK